MAEVLSFLQQQAQADLLPWTSQTEAAKRFNLSIAAVEEIALENALLPARYQRNRNMLSCKQQLELFRSTVAVVGCGGLGGYILEGLARLGVGRIIAIDPDVFEEHNLNRQLLCDLDSLGQPKTRTAAQRILKINPAVEVTPHQKAFGKENGASLLKGARVVVDALDSVTVRLELAQTCEELYIPLVHGAIAGWYGHVTTIFPGDKTLENIYGQQSTDRGVEKELGNPSFTPALVASIQTTEVCKVLLDQGSPLRQRILSIDLKDMEFEELAL